MVILCHHLVCAHYVNVMNTLLTAILSLENVKYVVSMETFTHMVGCYRIVETTRQALIVSSACPVTSMSHPTIHLPAKHAAVHQLAAGNQIIFMKAHITS